MMLMFPRRSRLSSADSSMITILWMRIMELSQAVAALLFVLVSLQILLPIVLCSGSLPSIAGKQLFVMEIRLSADPGFVELLASGKVLKSCY